MPDPSEDPANKLDTNHLDPQPEPESTTDTADEDARIQKMCEEFSQRDPRDMLATIETFLRKHLVCDEYHYTILTLWVVHTWCFECFPSTPYLDIRSPESQSGKTLCLELLHTLSEGPWLATGPRPDTVTGALLSEDRLIASWPLDLEEIDEEETEEEDIAEQEETNEEEDTDEEDEEEDRFNPSYSTFLLDDCHHTFGPSERQPLLAQLNSGSRQSCRYVAGSECFCLFGPKAFAGNAPLSRSLASRCIPIVLRRKKPSEHVTRFPADGFSSMPPELFTWRIVWTIDHRDDLSQAAQQAPPNLPANLTPRQQDCAEPLLHIADSIGGNWPDRARAAIVAVFGLSESSLGVQLLADIRSAFLLKENPEHLSTSDLLAALTTYENRPWSAWPPSPLKSGRRLGALLGPFGINSDNLRLEGDKIAKGYKLLDFQDSWERYLPAMNHPQSGGSADVTGASDVRSATENASATPSATANILSINELQGM